MPDEIGKFVESIPRDKSYPADAVQCDGCGGHGCDTCAGQGWLPAGHASGRVCLNPGCGKPLHPTFMPVYCSNDCAFEDA